MTFEKKKTAVGTAIFVLNLVVAIGAISTGHFREWLSAGLGNGPAKAVEARGTLSGHRQEGRATKIH